MSATTKILGLQFLLELVSNKHARYATEMIGRRRAGDSDWRRAGPDAVKGSATDLGALRSRTRRLAGRGARLAAPPLSDHVHLEIIHLLGRCLVTAPRAL
jgi:hypothetical protein